jgi:hypothetical protein
MNSKRIAFGIGIALAVLAVLVAPVMADDQTFYFVPDTVIIEPGEEVTVLGYLNTTEKVSAFQSCVVYDQNVVECLDIVEVEDVSNWYLWAYEGTGYPTSTDKEYFWYGGVEFMGLGPGDLVLGNITLRGVSPGISTLHVAWNEEIPDPNNSTIVVDMGQPSNLLPWVSETLTVICGSPETFTKSLDLGWNLISLPLTPLNDSTSAVLDNDTFVYDKVYSYNASTNQFVDVTDGTMETGVGYFVDVTTAGTWSYEGYGMMPPDVGDLEQGLNCIGWTNTSATLPDALGNMGNYCDWWYVARLNATSQKYELYDADAPEGVPEFIDFDTMERGEGYFIVTKNPYCTFAYP